MTRCGGITEFLRGAGLAAVHNLQVSGHCAPNLHAHVAAAVPNLRHVEYFHDYQRIERVLFDGTLDPHGGVMRPDPDRAGHGMTLRDTDAEPFRCGDDRAAMGGGYTSTLGLVYGGSGIPRNQAHPAGPFPAPVYRVC